MCLLTFYSEGAEVNAEALVNGAWYNDDGHGYAILIGGEIRVRKSADAAKLIEEFAALRAKHPEGPAMFHSRFTTDGIQGKYNMHPFTVNGYRKTVLAHNGVMPQEARPRAGDIRSDTRIVAERIISKYGFDLTSRRGRRRFGRWMGTNNKVAFITLDPRFARNWYIVNESSGTWEDGVWYSNDGYKPRTYKSSTWTYVGEDGSDGWEYDPVSKVYFKRGEGYTKWWEHALDTSDKDYCILCMSIGSVDRVTNFCSICHSCQDCSDDWDDCMCFIPTGSKRAADAYNIVQKALESSASKSKLEQALETLPDSPDVVGGWPLD